MDQRPIPLPLAGRDAFRARAFFLGERIDLRSFEAAARLATLPLTLAVAEGGCAVVFRYGVAVLFGVPAPAEEAFLASLRPLVTAPLPRPELEETEVRLRAGEGEKVEGEALWLPAATVERLQLIAELLARAVVLNRYEAEVDREFDRVEPLAVSLRRRRFSRALGKGLLEHIGGALLSQQQMVGRVALSDKPELLWEHPELERFYARLEDEYEIRERHRVLEQKMAVISRTAQTILDLLHARRSLRVEWYIVILIVVEILLTLYELFLHP